MGDIFGKTVGKAFTIIVVAIVIIAAGESILTNDTTKDVFGELMGNLPFAKPIADVISNLMEINKNKNIPLDDPSDIFRDMLMLLVMSCIRRPVMSILSRIFLRVPDSSDYVVIEEYMESFTYKMKETVLNVLLAPGLAFMASVLLTNVMEYVESTFGKFGILALFIVLFVLSLFSLIIGKRGLSVGNAILWRFFITLVGELLSTLCIIAASIWIYLAIYCGTLEQVIVVIFPFLIMFLLIQASIDSLSKVIANR